MREQYEAKAHKEALTGWLAENDWTVFGTLKSTDGFNISEQRAEKDLRKFFNTLDRLYLGASLVKCGHRVERVVFKHFGRSGDNLHFHFLARPDGNIDDFCETARCVWDQTSSFTLGYEHTVIERVRSVEHTVRYGMHEIAKLGVDTLFLPTTHFARDTPKPKPIHKLRRLIKRQMDNEVVRENALRRESLAARR